jgi:hypothetical protein
VTRFESNSPRLEISSLQAVVTNFVADVFTSVLERTLKYIESAFIEWKNCLRKPLQPFNSVTLPPVLQIFHQFVDMYLEEASISLVSVCEPIPNHVCRSNDSLP